MAIVEASRSPALVTVYRSISDLLKRKPCPAARRDERRARHHRLSRGGPSEVFLSILARRSGQGRQDAARTFAIGDELRRKSYIAAFTRKGAPQEEEKEADS